MSNGVPNHNRNARMDYPYDNRATTNDYEMKNRDNKSPMDSEQSNALLPDKEKKDLDVVIEHEAFPPKSPDDDDDNGWNDDDDEDISTSNFIGKFVITLQQGFKAASVNLNKVTRGYLTTVVFLIAYLVYFIYAMAYEFGSEPSVRLLVCTLLGVIIVARHKIFALCRWLFRKAYGSERLSPLCKKRVNTVKFFMRWILYGLLAGVTVWILIDQGKKNLSNLRSLPGLFIFLFICLLFSTHPSKVNWHTIYWAFGLQFLAALFALKWSVGKDMILWIQRRLDEFFANSDEGSKFLFGETYKDHYMIFGALPIVFLTNATLTVLYYLGAMQFIIRVIGSLLSFFLGTAPVESMSVAAGIFLEGITAILSLRPYLNSMTKSQLFLVITSVFSSLGGAYLAILSSMGVSLEYLIPAMVVSAPATFAVCKLMIPETHLKEGDEKKTDHIDIGAEEQSKYANILDAAQTGATSMVSLVGNVATVAFAFFSYISWINKTLTWFGDRVGIDELTIERISSYILYPVALAMGIEPDDCRNCAMLLGYRIGVTNIVAFFKLTTLKINKAQYMQYMTATNYTGPVTHKRDDIILDLWNTTLKNGFISDRSEAIITYCLCGFSSCMTVAITIGIMFALLPHKKTWIAKIAVPALIAGNVANCMTGCFASIFY